MSCYHCKCNIDEYDLFCHNCGKDLKNRCSNQQCQYSYITLEPSDKYCRLCGSKTIFEEKSYNDNIFEDILF